MALADILKITINTTSQNPTLPGFGVPLIFGVCSAWGVSQDRIRYYTGTAGLLSDGFAVTDPEYKAASAIFAQKNPPPRVAVGRRALKPTMVTKVLVLSAVVGKVYSVYVNGVKKSYTAIGGDTAILIATGLVAAIGAVAGFTVANGGTATISFTASAAGNWVGLAVDDFNANSFLDIWQDHADPGAQADLTAISNADSTWYAVLSTFAGTTGATNTSEVGQIAAWTEANQRLYLADVQDTVILSALTTDIGSKLKALSYARTAPLWHVDNGAFAAAAWAGACLPLDPGSETWKFKLLVGVTPTQLTATQSINADGKNVNTYQNVSGGLMTSEGVVADREFVDTIRFRDWLAATMQNDIFGVLLNTKKVPYTDPGGAVIEAQIRSRLEKGVAVGGLAASPAYTVTVPPVSTQATADRQARKMRNITWTAQLAGAIHSGEITGTVTV